MEQNGPVSNGKHTQYLGILDECIGQKTFVRLILGKYRGKEPDLRTVEIRMVRIKGEDMLSFVYRYKSKDITKNFSLEEGIGHIRRLLGGEFKSAHLFSLSNDMQIEFSKRGRCIMSSGQPTSTSIPHTSHNREKERLIDPASPFLSVLGITSPEHKVLPSMSRKWKQINVFLGIFQKAVIGSQIARDGKISVVDFGSGKGYLTFAIYDFLRSSLKAEPHVTGVELREDLVKFCNDAAMKLGMDNLRFCRGDLRSFDPGKIQVMIALHACDTATDHAIHMGIRTGAEIIMCAPCCHKELRPQISAPPALHAVLRHGVHLGQEAEMLTDSLRALLLEASGYDAQIFEFISLEHTSKNKMILAVRRDNVPGRKEEAMSRIRELKGFYGIEGITLEKLLGLGT